MPVSWHAAGPIEAGQGCNPLAPEWDCLLPYPCDFFVAKADTASGFKLEIPAKSRPTMTDGEVFDPTDDWPLNGFPVASQIAVLIPGGVAEADLVFHTGDIDSTTTSASHTLLIEAATGKRIPHFAEIDPRPEDEAKRALILRPLIRLETGRRYVVALQGLTHPDGKVVEAPSGFKALRDGSDSPAITARLRRYYDAWVWTALAKAGVAQDKTQLAWDFTTAFRNSPLVDLNTMLATARAAIKALPPKITITDVNTGPKDGGPWKIEGTIALPWFLDSDEPGGRLLRNAAGSVAPTKAPRLVRYNAYIPKSAFGALTPARVIVAGHGFFADARELQRDDYVELFEHLGAIGIGVDWLGLSKADISLVLNDLLENLDGSGRLVDRLQQSIVNGSCLIELVVNGQLPHLVGLAGNTAWLPKKVTPYYYGASLGHILGSTLVAHNPDIARSALQVGGANLGMIMPRSQPFGGLLTIVDGRTPDKLVSLKVTLLLQAALSRIEPLLMAPDTIGPSKKLGLNSRPVLMQVGIGDASVPTLAAQLHARSMGLGHDHPAPRTVWGLPKFDASKHESMYVEVDMGVAEPAVKAIPPSGENEVHEGIRRIDAIRAQIDAFLRPGGLAKHTCDGPCDKGG